LYDTNVSNLDLQYDESIVSQANKNFVERKWQFFPSQGNFNNIHATNWFIKY
jgi:hypothetical protein